MVVPDSSSVALRSTNTAVLFDISAAPRFTLTVGVHICYSKSQQSRCLSSSDVL